jgi:hypothetical protein
MRHISFLARQGNLPFTQVHNKILAFEKKSSVGKGEALAD